MQNAAIVKAVVDIKNADAITNISNPPFQNPVLFDYICIVTRKLHLMCNL